MKIRLHGKGLGLVAFVGICTLVVGGLGWVTAATLRLEEGQHRADFEKEFNAQLSLVMWRLDSRVAPRWHGKTAGLTTITTRSSPRPSWSATTARR